MFRARRKRNFNREKWPWSWFRRRRRIRERFCPKCERPYLETPIPREIVQFVSGSAASLVYPSSRFGRKQFVVRVGRWQASTRGFWLADLIEQDDLDDLMRVTAKAQKYIDTQMGHRARWCR